MVGALLADYLGERRFYRMERYSVFFFTESASAIVFNSRNPKRHKASVNLQIRLSDLIRASRTEFPPKRFNPEQQRPCLKSTESVKAASVHVFFSKAYKFATDVHLVSHAHVK